jgi:hypothetical protein
MLEPTGVNSPLFEGSNYQLSEVNRRERFLRNVVGGIIRVPDPDYKDLPNRFIQSEPTLSLSYGCLRYTTCA